MHIHSDNCPFCNIYKSAFYDIYNDARFLQILKKYDMKDITKQKKGSIIIGFNNPDIKVTFSISKSGTLRRKPNKDALEANLFGLNTGGAELTKENYYKIFDVLETHLDKMTFKVDVDDKLMNRIESLEQKRLETKDKISALERENRQHIAKVTKILDKVDFEYVQYVPSGASSQHSIYYNDKNNKNKSIALNTVNIFNMLIGGLFHQNHTLLQVEKKLFDLHQDLDEELTILEAQLNKQHKIANKTQDDYYKTMTKEIKSLFKEVKPDIKLISEGRRIVSRASNITIELEQNIKEQLHKIFTKQ